MASASLLFASFLPNHIMLRLWPNTNDPQLTPKASEKNPFELAQAHTHHHTHTLSPRPYPCSPGAQTPTGVHPLLCAAPVSPYLQMSSTQGSFSLNPDLTPTLSHPPAFASAQPTTHLSLHAPVFNMQQPPPGKKSSMLSSSSSKKTSPSSSSSRSTSSTAATSVASAPAQAPAPSSAVSRGQLHVKLLQARALTVRGSHARPYVVVQFENNEFVSRDPIPETEREVKGAPTNLSRQSSSNAINALGAIGYRDAKRRSKESKESPPSSLVPTASRALHPSASSSSTAPPPSSGITTGLFGRLSPHNPVWKHEVTFDVTDEESLLRLNIYDRAAQDQGFTGTVQIKPVLVHDHTVDQWYK
ncbi:hypothetical protein D9619_000972 [Psilocybe cf. subviscida]|uniref:C2 domain-containing protein n=1 Tax=Psilocybe cf. subviscida TaxID=2480587 RepID=A0A8H5BGP3_9AGAR|nr:hypothetical protein D9619_000972 [Psilocybe cf. subviscida]